MADLTQYNFIPEFVETYSDYREAKRLLNKRRARLSRIFTKYEFVSQLVNPNVDDFQLEEHVRALFSDLGYTAWRPTENANFDVIAKFKNVVGIEVKNSNGLAENDMFQALKYAGRHRATGTEVHPILIWNNTKSNQSFDKNRKDDALSHGYAIMTTRELLKGYTRVKSGQISFRAFHSMICKSGEIVFSLKGIKGVES